MKGESEIKKENNEIPARDKIFPKSRAESFRNTRSLIHKIGEYKRKKVGSYLELYGTLSGTVQ